LKEVLAFSFPDVAAEIPHTIQPTLTRGGPGQRGGFHASSQQHKRNKSSGILPASADLSNLVTGESFQSQTLSAASLSHQATQKAHVVVFNDNCDEKSQSSARPENFKLARIQHSHGLDASSPSTPSLVLFDEEDHFLSLNDEYDIHNRLLQGVLVNKDTERWGAQLISSNSLTPFTFSI
jgi:hypothetical protein